MDDCDLDSPTICEDEESASFEDDTTELTETDDDGDSDGDSAIIEESESNSDSGSDESGPISLSYDYTENTQTGSESGSQTEPGSETDDDDDSAIIDESESNTDTGSDWEWSDAFDCGSAGSDEWSHPLWDGPKPDIWWACEGKPCVEGRSISSILDEKGGSMLDMICVDGIWIITTVGVNIGEDTSFDYTTGTENETGWESESQIEPGSESVEEEWSCSGPCCHGASVVQECVGQPCDAPIDYDYESKQAAPGDQKSPYYSEILKSKTMIHS